MRSQEAIKLTPTAGEYLPSLLSSDYKPSTATYWQTHAPHSPATWSRQLTHGVLHCDTVSRQCVCCLKASLNSWNWSHVFCDVITDRVCYVFLLLDDSPKVCEGFSLIFEFCVLVSSHSVVFLKSNQLHVSDDDDLVKAAGWCCSSFILTLVSYTGLLCGAVTVYSSLSVSQMLL